MGRFSVARTMVTTGWTKDRYRKLSKSDNFSGDELTSSKYRERTSAVGEFLSLFVIHLLSTSAEQVQGSNRLRPLPCDGTDPFFLRKQGAAFSLFEKPGSDKFLQIDISTSHET